MGTQHSQDLKYGVYVGEAKDGETRVIRSPLVGDKELVKYPKEGIDTLWRVFEEAVKNNPGSPFLGTRKKLSEDKFGEYEWKTYAEIMDLSKSFASSIVLGDLSPEHKSKSDGTFKFLGLYSKNREEWVVVDNACHALGITNVTFYDTLGDDTIGYILDQTKLKTLVMESKNLKKITALKNANKSADLQNIVLLDEESETETENAKKAGLNILYYPDLIKQGKEKPQELTPAKPETICTFCYTSGTTGNPKAAMLSHSGIIACCAAIQISDVKLRSDDRHLSYLPLAHVMEKVFVTCATLYNVAIGFYSGSPLRVIEDAKILRPTIFLGVPRIYQRVIESIKKKINSLGFMKKSLANTAINSKLDNLNKKGQLTHSIYDKLVFGNAKASLGGAVRIMVTGSAPMSKEAQDFIKICFSCPLLEGYGLTETIAGTTMTYVNDHRGGCVGGPVGSIELKLVDVPAMGYLSTNTDENGNSRPGGEICIRGNSVFSGYFDDETKTKEAIDEDGWFHSGDIGIILPHMGLKVVDRVKNIFKLSQGEYVAPEKLENTLNNHAYVSQIFIHGDSLESFIIAIIVPNKDTCVQFFHKLGKNDIDSKNVDSHLDDKELVQDVQKELETFGKKNGFKGFEVVKKVKLVAEPFTVENNLLTPSMKLKRFEAKNKYSDVIKELYSSQ